VGVSVEQTPRHGQVAVLVYGRAAVYAGIPVESTGFYGKGSAVVNRPAAVGCAGSGAGVAAENAGLKRQFAAVDYRPALRRTAILKVYPSDNGNAVIVIHRQQWGCRH
jgi:hypothetical protein